jgi:plasmid stability protein
MPSITIRHVPDDVRDELAARASAQGKSLQEYMLGLVTDTTSKPSIETLLERLRARKAVSGVELDTDELLGHLDADRR